MQQSGRTYIAIDLKSYYPQAHRLHHHVCRTGRAYGGATAADGIVP